MRSRDFPLPAPFDQIVRKGMSGEWGLAQIGAALNVGEAVQAQLLVRRLAAAGAATPEAERWLSRWLRRLQWPPPSVIEANSRSE